MRDELDDDDGQDDDGRDEWVIATWRVAYHIELVAVCEKDGKPWLDAWDTAWPHTWFKWRSYHAARKFQRSHPGLDGYEILNLSRLKRADAARRERDKKGAHKP